MVILLPILRPDMAIFATDLLYEFTKSTDQNDVRFAIFVHGIHLVVPSIVHGSLATRLRVFNIGCHP